LRLRHVPAAVLLTLPLAGCWQVPPPPADNSTDAYGWRAAIDLGGNEPYYRFELPADLSAWMTEHDTRAFSVFDAAGKLQECRIMGAESNDPMATIEHIATASVTEFDGNACNVTDEPRVCFKDQPCAWPAYCQPQLIDLTGTSLQAATSLDALLAAANETPFPPDCAPESAGATRACDARDDAARRDYRVARDKSLEARELLQSSGLGESEQRRNVQANLSGHYASSAAPPPQPMSAMGGRRQAAMSPQTPDHYVLSPVRRTSQQSGGYAIEFDTAPHDLFLLNFVWNVPASQGFVGNATLTCYNSSGTSSDYPMNIQSNARRTGDFLTQTFGPRCDAKAYRVVVGHSAIANLALSAVTATSYIPKPFIQKDKKTYWFKPSGKAPYGLYLEKSHGTCVGMGSPNELKQLAHVTEPQWPPALRAVSMPEENRRSAWAKLRASNNELVAWIYWAVGVGGAALSALLVTLLRWWWFASRKVP